MKTMFMSLFLLSRMFLLQCYSLAILSRLPYLTSDAAKVSLRVPEVSGPLDPATWSPSL